MNAHLDCQGIGQGFRSCTRQRGAVLVAALVLLLVIAFVGFSAMETSHLASKMATARELQEQAFQAAESVIEITLDNAELIDSAHAVGIRGDTNWPTAEYELGQDSALTGSATVRFVGSSAIGGHSIRRGANGIALHHYEVEATATRRGSNFSSTLVQGIQIEGPSHDSP